MRMLAAFVGTVEKGLPSSHIRTTIDVFFSFALVSSQTLSTPFPSRSHSAEKLLGLVKTPKARDRTPKEASSNVGDGLAGSGELW